MELGSLKNIYDMTWHTNGDQSSLNSKQNSNTTIKCCKNKKKGCHQHKTKSINKLYVQENRKNRKNSMANTHFAFFGIFGSNGMAGCSSS